MIRDTFNYETHYLDTASSGRIAYFDEGRGHALIFLHGLVGEFTHFRFVAPALASEFRVIGIDMPGCGQSSKHAAQPHTVRSYARAVLDVMDALGVKSATLVGHSLGGLIAGEIALSHPERVSDMVLINAAGMRKYGATAYVAARAFLRPALLRPTLEHIALPLLDRVFHARNEYTRFFVADALGRPRHPTLGEMARVFRDFAHEMLRPRILENAERITMPTLVLWGERDRLVPMGEVARCVARIPRGGLEVIPACGHMPIIEYPETVVRAIRGFLHARTVVRRAA